MSFQTFSGTSRRPRQVNLSGQNLNPFAAGAWTPSTSGTSKTVANAQQERQQRQQERDRLNASKQIQKVWRGHRTRRELAELRRGRWDAANAQQGDSISAPRLIEQVKLLVTFFNPRHRADTFRLVHLSQAICLVGYHEYMSRREVQPQLPRLANITLKALKVSLPECPVLLLQLLVAIIERRPECFPPISQSYYKYLSNILTAGVPGISQKKVILASLRVPLAEMISDQGHDINVDSYTAFSLHFLTTPELADLLGGLDDLLAVVNVGLLSTALVRQFSANAVDKIPPVNRLWLLAHFISLHRLQRRSGQDPEFLRALSLQLYSSSNDIVGRIDSTESSILQEAMDDEESDKIAVQPLPSFIKEELMSLVNQARISGLLAKFNMNYAKGSGAGDEDASLLASYALTLLRIFPHRRDEIRMWLYLGSMTTSTKKQVPALKFFWQAMSLTKTFSDIRADSKAALILLRSQTERRSSVTSSSNVAADLEWRTVLLFLELYAFVLRFTDDEEFLSGKSVNTPQDSVPISRIRESALALEDVQRLTIFLKNLAFATYYNAGELADGGRHDATVGSIGNYFGMSTSSSRFEPVQPENSSPLVVARPFAGIAGMTFEYVRTAVTRVLRMLYERDSRRRFLPKDHWLMTSRFEMEGFIPAVVMEEERQHQVGEDGDDEVDGAQFHETDTHLGLVGTASSRRHRQMETMRHNQQQAARKKMLAAVGPRLEVLQNMPFVIPFETRVQIFRQFVFLDQTRRRGGNVDPDIWRMSIVQQARLQSRHSHAGRELLGRHHAKIRRDQIFDDAFEQFYELGEGLKEPIQITFVDQFDTVEAGIDGGGVTKEFLTSVTNEAFRSDTGSNLFTTNDQNLLYPNPAAIDERREWLKEAGLKESSAEWQEHMRELLMKYEFLGRVVGKCLYESILIDISFAGFFLLKWAASGGAGAELGGYRANVNDLRDLDESLYQGLLKLKNYTGDVEDFGLDFTITDTVSFTGASTLTIERELMPNGSKTPVTNENRPLYVSYVARHRLQVQPYQQTQAFLRGLGDIIKPSWLSMFNQSELQTLIGGDAAEIDVQDLRDNTLYGGVYQIGDDGQEHTTVQLFWQVMKDLEDEDRRKVLKYVTSTPRSPLLGFCQLNPRFSIRDSGSDETRLPSTSTCVNLLKLPRYSTASTLKSKLLYAVNSGAGFDLS